MTVPRRRLWRLFFWIAAIALIIEALGLTSTFIELRRRRVGISGGLVADQIAAVVHLWPSLDEEQRRDVLTAISSAGLRYRITSEGPVETRQERPCPRGRGGCTKAAGVRRDGDVAAFIRAKPFGREHRAINWALSTEPVQVYVRLAGASGLSPRCAASFCRASSGYRRGFGSASSAYCWPASYCW